MDAKWYHKFMATLTIKQVPPEIVERLKDRAAINGRSMNKELIACLEAVLIPRERTAEERIREAQVLWESLRVKDLGPYDPSWKREGRP